jgi:NDP-sugar pyrophosphorylase family protein
VASHRSTRSGITALILAAGANTRLESILPPGLKPLVIVNGKTLFKHAVDHANGLWNVDRVVAVVAPDNARPLTQVGGADDWVVQPRPEGVLDAIRRGLRAVWTPWTLILCADNTFDVDTGGLIQLQHVAGRVPAFVSRRLAPEDERRFTRYVRHGDSSRFVGPEYTGPTDGCWIGPLCLSTEGLGDGSMLPSIIDCVNVAATGQMLTPIAMNCADLGIPEAL